MKKKKEQNKTPKAKYILFLKKKGETFKGNPNGRKIA